MKKRVLTALSAAVMICAAALSGCSASEPAKSESSSTSQTQSASAKPEPSSAVPKSSSSTTSSTSSATSSTKSQWTRSSYTVPKLPSKSSSSSSKATPWTKDPYSVPTIPSGSVSKAIPWTFPEDPEQKRLGVTSNWSDFLHFAATPGAVIVTVDEKGNDLVEDSMFMYIIMNIPYDKISESYYVIPVNSPVMVYGSSAHARSAYSELIKLRPDIPEIMCFVAA